VTTTAEDAVYMARALELAHLGMNTTDPNPRVGCVIVKNGKIISEGWHERAGGPHAEIIAIENAHQDHLYGATVYVTLEPCSHHGRTPPCVDALLKTRPQRVVIAMEDPNSLVAGSGIRALEEAGIVVAVGLMEAEAKALNPGYISRMTKKRPLVRVKLATSLDGRTALESGVSKWITGEDARRDVHRWRARSSAILTGVSTILMDDPSLNVRYNACKRQPLRIVLDSNLRISPDARVIKIEGKTLIVTASQDHAAATRLQDAGAEVLIVATKSSRIDLHALMLDLVAREINEIHIEAGATLCGALLYAGIVDEIVLYLAPHLLGADGRGMFKFPALEKMADRYKLKIRDVRAVGEDWRVIADVINLS